MIPGNRRLVKSKDTQIIRVGMRGKGGENRSRVNKNKEEDDTMQREKDHLEEQRMYY